MRLHQLTSLLFCFLFTSTLFSQIEISEYSASNMNQFPDEYGKYEDWIEIHNTSDEMVDISGYGISDKESKPQKWLIPEGVMMAPDEYLVIWCSGRELNDRSLHASFKLTQTKENEFVLLSDPEGNIIESSALDITLLAHSRIKDAEGNWIVNTNPSPGSGDNMNNTFQAYTEAPIIEQEAGFYADSLVVNISTNQTGGTLRYSIDGNAPNANSAEYAGPITIDETTVVKAIYISDDPSIFPGKIDFKTYFINESFGFPVFSIAADGLQDLANGNKDLRPIGSIEYFVDGELSSNSYGELNSHGQDSWVNDQRSLDWVSRDEMGYNKALKEQLFLYSDRDEYQRFMLRASGDDNYPAINDGNHEGSTHMRDEYVHTLAQDGNMKLDLRAIERAIVFLNGDYWGVYSPRERPVDHDYTAYTYDQGKYDLQYILTWGETWAEYGGTTAFNEWIQFREFILNSDMSDPDNYQIVKDNMQVLSLIDYVIINLASVCSDWMNYNTGWWRGTDPEGGHKKWGYILWDNDATFDYYINYSGVPNTQPDAVPCDFEAIGDYMDQFWGDGGGFTIDSSFAGLCNSITDGSSPYPASDPIFLQVVNAEFSCCFEGWSDDCEALYEQFANGNGNGGGLDSLDGAMCPTIIEGSSPYPASDSIFLIVIAEDDYCCDSDWDDVCQNLYNDIENGNNGNGGNEGPEEEVRYYENFGKHEKIFFKLLEESPEFKQLYYSRQADLMNTVFSCENMLATLDRLAEEIRPEMPRHIQRWGGSVEEWESNVARLRSFVEQRCELMDDGMLECYEVEGPHTLTLEIFPEGAGDIDFNTIEIKEFPWTGEYFGNMENLIDADPDSDHDFVRWEVKGGSMVLPSLTDENARLVLTGQDTLVAIFELEGTTTGVNDIEETNINLNVFPSPASDVINVVYTLDQASKVDIELLNVLGQKVLSQSVGQKSSQQEHRTSINIKNSDIINGNYIIRLTTEQGFETKKLAIAR